LLHPPFNVSRSRKADGANVLPQRKSSYLFKRKKREKIAAVKTGVVYSNPLFSVKIQKQGDLTLLNLPCEHG